MVTKEECIKAIEEALKLFGTYTYQDKGADEVMDMRKFQVDIRAMISSPDGVDNVAKLLIEVNEHEYGYGFVSSILNSLQDLPDNLWNRLMSYEELEELF